MHRMSTATPGFAGDLPQKGRFAAVAFDEDMATCRRFPPPRIASTRPGNPAPEPRSSQVRALGRSILPELGAIGEMPVPDVVERARRDEVDRLLPTFEQANSRKSRVFRAFHVKFRTPPEIHSGLSIRGQAIRRCLRSGGRPSLTALRRASSVSSAAGVMPSMRPAWAIVAGR